MSKTTETSPRAPTASPTPAATATPADTTGGSGPQELVLVVLGVVAVGAIALIWLRRRPTGPQTPG